MKTQTLRFKKGKKYHIDDLEYSQGSFYNNFDNLPTVHNCLTQHKLSDYLICLRDCSITIRWKEPKEVKP